MSTGAMFSHQSPVKITIGSHLKHLTRSLLAIYNPEGEAREIYIANKLRVMCLTYL